MDYLDNERFFHESSQEIQHPNRVYIITDGYRELARDYNEADALFTFNRLDSESGMTLGYIDENDIDHTNWQYTMDLLTIIAEKK